MTRTRIEFLLFVCAFYRISGGYVGGVTPVPISNTEVKPSRADGTARFPCGRVGRCRNFYQNAPPSALYEPTAGRSLFVLRSLAAALRYDGAARGGVRGPGLRPSRARGAWVLRATLVARHCERRKPGTTTPPRVLPRDRAGCGAIGEWACWSRLLVATRSNRKVALLAPLRCWRRCAAGAVAICARAPFGGRKRYFTVTRTNLRLPTLSR